MVAASHRIPIHTPNEQYDIHIGAGVLAELGAHVAALTAGRNAFLISHPSLADLYGAAVTASLQTSGFKVSTYLVPEGEQSKTLASASQLYTHLAQAGADLPAPRGVNRRFERLRCGDLYAWYSVRSDSNLSVSDG
jgi:3-dehydroquinate synthetase